MADNSESKPPAKPVVPKPPDPRPDPRLTAFLEKDHRPVKDAKLFDRSPRTKR